MFPDIHSLAMDLKSALTKLKTAGVKHTIPFLFCESDAKGKPLVLVGTITPEQKTKALTGAKSAKTATGNMSINAQGDLCLRVKGSTLPTLAKGFATAAANAGARSIFKEVELETGAETNDAAAAMKNSPDNNNNLPDKGSGPGAKAKAPTKNKVTSGYVDLDSQRETPPTADAPVSAYGKSPAVPPSADGLHASSYGKSPATPVAQSIPPSAQDNGPDLDNNNVVDALSGERPTSDSVGSKVQGSSNNYVDDGKPPEEIFGRDVFRPQFQKDFELDEANEKKQVQEIKEGKKEVEDADLVLPPRKIERSTGPAKKFPDPLRQSPVMAEILRKRDILRKKFKIAEAEGDENAIKLIKTAAVKLQRALENAQRKLNETGMVPQRMSEEYEGEDEKFGWRATNKPMPFVDNAAWTPEERAYEKGKHEIAMRDWEADRDSVTRVTHYFTEEEREKSAISVNEDGKFVDANGKLVTTSNEYVMDAETGQMHQFRGHVQEVNKEVPNRKGGTQFQQQSVHHSSVLSGKEIGGAGGMRIVKGELQEVTNASGHYKPGIGPMMQTVEALLQQGALLSKKWCGKDGQELSGKPAELLKRVRALQERVEKKVKADPQADVATDSENIEKALKLLAKLGAGPENKFGPAKVGFLDIKKTMTGADIKDPEKKVIEHKAPIPVEEFLRTGGDNKTQTKAKKNVLKELKSKTADLRGQLDKEHTTTGEGSVDPTDEELDAAAPGVDPSNLEPEASVPKKELEEAKEGTPPGQYSKE